MAQSNTRLVETTAQSNMRSIETVPKYRIKFLDVSIETEVGPTDTCADVEARIAEKHGLSGPLTWHAPFETRDVNKLWKENQGSNLVRDTFPKSCSFHLRHFPDKPIEAKAAVGTEGDDYAIDNNIVEDEGDQDNVVSYFEQHVGRVVARISQNKVSGKGKQSNHIGGPRNSASRL